MTNLIVGAFFCSKPDPQRPNTAHSTEGWDDYTYLWRTTAKALGVPVALIVDHEAITGAIAESDVSDVVVHHPLNLTTNDERIIAFRNYLERVTCDKVLLTDTGDVYFKKNPFDFITDEHFLFLGSDRKSTPRVRNSFWLVQKLYFLNQELPAEERFIPAHCFPKLLAHPKLQRSKNFRWKILRQLARIGHLLLPRTPGSIWEAPMVSAGVIGGKREDVLSLLRRMCELIELPATATDLNLNMAALNFAVWRDKLDFFAGPPFTNDFKSFDTTGPHYICHK